VWKAFIGTIALTWLYNNREKDSMKHTHAKPHEAHFTLAAIPSAMTKRLDNNNVALSWQ